MESSRKIYLIFIVIIYQLFITELINFPVFIDWNTIRLHKFCIFSAICLNEILKTNKLITYSWNIFSAILFLENHYHQRKICFKKYLIDNNEYFTFSLFHLEFFTSQNNLFLFIIIYFMINLSQTIAESVGDWEKIIQINEKFNIFYRI